MAPPVHRHLAYAQSHLLAPSATRRGHAATWFDTRGGWTDGAVLAQPKLVMLRTSLGCQPPHDPSPSGLLAFLLLLVQVREMIRLVRPSTVMLELCSGRLARLRSGGTSDAELLKVGSGRQGGGCVALRAGWQATRL